MTRAELAFGALDRNKKGYITAKESLNISEWYMLQHVLSCCRTWASWPRSCLRMRLPVCWQNLTPTVTVSSASRSSRCFLRRRTRGRRRVRRRAEKTWSDITQPRLVSCPLLSCRPWLNVSAKFAPNKHVKPSDLSNTVRHNFKQTLSQIEKNFCFKSSNEKIFYFHLHLTIFKMYISYNTIERECLYRNLSLVGSVFVSAFYVKAIFRANDWAHCVRTWSSSSSPCLISLESCWSCIFEVIFLFDDRTLSLSLYNKMILLHGIPDQAM